MSISCSLDKDEEGNPVEESKYQGIIDYLLYLTAPCLDIKFIVCLCGRFQTNPRESHLTTLKGITLHKWVYGTPKGTNYALVGYSYLYFSRYKLDKKSTNTMSLT